jgi:tetratricopeptide (TPR) repeat protein
MARDDAELLRAERAAQARPQDANAQGRLGTLLIEAARAAARGGMARREDHWAAAATLYRRAITHLEIAARLTPAPGQALRHAGIAFRELGNFEEAARVLQAAAQAAPDDPDIAVDLAFARQSLGQTDAAIAAYEAVLAKHPGHANAHASLALSLLGAGDYARGWEEYEWRRRVPGADIVRDFPFPEWRGDALEGRTLFVHSEQGIGDEIMFASCFGELVEKSGHCVIECSRRLASLMRRSFRRATILERDRSRPPDWSALPRVDLQIPAGSLPRLLRREASRFPGTGYLRPDPERVEYWRSAFDTRPGELRVGIAWSGGLPDTLRAARSLALDVLEPLLSLPAARFFSLELLDRTPEVAALASCRGIRIEHRKDLAAQPDETAGLMATLDLLITVPTTVAHLAGALEVPVWVLVPVVPTWRYGWSGERSPWYRSMRILRRAAHEDLPVFIDGVARRLGSLTRT